MKRARRKDAVCLKSKGPYLGLKRGTEIWITVVYLSIDYYRFLTRTTRFSVGRYSKFTVPSIN